MQKSIGVGITVIIFKGSKVLLGRRKSAHAKGTWGFPGGKMEHSESFESAIGREIHEECIVRVSKPVLYAVTNDFFKESGKHYVTIFMRARYLSGSCKAKEPDKSEDYQWFSKNKLPKPLMLPIINLLKTTKSL